MPKKSIPKSKYEECKMKKMDTVMKEYETGALKSRGLTNVKSRKQAVAIGLSIAEKQCAKKFSKKDAEKIEKKLEGTIYKRGQYNKLPLTHVKDAKALAEYYKNNKQYSKSKALKEQTLKHSLQYVKHNLGKDKRASQQILDEISNMKI